MALVLSQVKLLEQLLEQQHTVLVDEDGGARDLNEEELIHSDRQKLELAKVVCNNLIKWIPLDLVR